MADHYRKSVDLLEEAADLRDELTEAYKAGVNRSVVASLHDRIRSTTKAAEVHSNLAIAQAIQDAAPQPVRFEMRP